MIVYKNHCEYCGEGEFEDRDDYLMHVYLCEKEYNGWEEELEEDDED